jgi:uncharacterized protein YbjT (DUF2867 family)
MKVLVLGGTGFVGRSLCALLSTKDGRYRVTVPSRRPSAARHLWMQPDVQLTRADVHDPAQLARLVAGHDAVFNLIAILHGSESQFRRAHVEFVKTLIEACKAGGVRRVIHVSALGVDSAQPSLYLRSKAEGEALLNASNLAVTVLRPSVMFGEHDRFLNLFGKLSAFAPVFPLAGADAQFQPVWVEDIASAILACLERPETAGQVFECAGPGVFSLAELVQLAGRWSGHERAVIPLPSALGRLQAAAMELLPGEPLMSRDNLDSMRTPNIASGRRPSLANLGIQAATLESVAPGYLRSDKGVGRLDRWRAGR